MVKKFLHSLLILLAGASTSWSADPTAERYTLGVLPYLSAVRLEPIYVPVSIEMGASIGRKIDFRTASSDKKYFQKLKQQTYDFALIQPFWFPPAVDQFDYVPLVRFSEPLTAIFMVLDDSPIKSIQDLQGKTIATPPAFTPIVHMARRELINRGLIPGKDVELKAVRAIDSCIQQVIIGAASACVGPNFASKMIASRLDVRPRTILETPGIPGFSIVAHKRVPEAERNKIKDLLLTWGVSDNGKHDALLKEINTSGFVSVISSEYDVVRSFLRDLKSAGE